jgi:hypothetical protein
MKGILIGDKGMADFPGMEKWKKRIPRGRKGVKNASGKQATWSDVAGCWDEETKRVIIGKGMHGSADLAIHETVHGMGDLLGLDDSPDLVAHHRRLFEKVSDYEQQGGPGGRAGRQEMLSEAAARLVALGRERAVFDYDEEFIDWLQKVTGL